MTAPTVAVTCTASDQGGEPVAGAVYTARLDRTEIYQGFVVPERVSATAGADGVATLNLWPNALGVAGSLYTITAINPATGKKFLNTTAAVPNNPCNLHEILAQEPYPPVDAAQQALIGAQAAAAAALAAIPLQCLPIACSDETTALTVGAAKITFRMPYAMTLTAVRASVTTAPTGSALTVDISEGGVSILPTKLTIDAGEKTSVTAAAPAVIGDTALADDAEITISITGVGSTIAGAGLKVYLIGVPA